MLTEMTCPVGCVPVGDWRLSLGLECSPFWSELRIDPLVVGESRAESGLCFEADPFRGFDLMTVTSDLVSLTMTWVSAGREREPFPRRSSMRIGAMLFFSCPIEAAVKCAAMDGGAPVFAVVGGNTAFALDGVRPVAGLGAELGSKSKVSGRASFASCFALRMVAIFSSVMAIACASPPQIRTLAFVGALLLLDDKRCSSISVSTPTASTSLGSSTICLPAPAPAPRAALSTTGPPDDPLFAVCPAGASAKPIVSRRSRARRMVSRRSRLTWM